MFFIDVFGYIYEGNFKEVVGEIEVSVVSLCVLGFYLVVLF